MKITFCSSSGFGDIREKHKYQNQLDVFFLLLTVDVALTWFLHFIIHFVSKIRICIELIFSKFLTKELNFYVADLFYIKQNILDSLHGQINIVYSIENCLNHSTSHQNLQIDSTKWSPPLLQ